MSLLGKYTDNLIEDDELEQGSSYITPAVLKNDEDISLKNQYLFQHCFTQRLSVFGL